MPAAIPVPSALTADKTEKGMMRERIKAVKPYRDTPECFLGVDGIPTSVLLYLGIGLRVFGRRWLGQNRSGFSAVSFPFVKLGVLFMDNKKIIGNIS